MTIQDFLKTTVVVAALSFAPPSSAQIQHNGTVPVAPQPDGMPPADPNAPFSVTAVTYAALPPNNHYSARLTSVAQGQAFGYLLMGVGLIYNPASQTLDISNQFSPAGSTPGLQVTGTDGPDQTGIFNDGTHGTRCFLQTPAGFSQDSRNATLISPTLLAAYYASACQGVDNGTPVGTAFNELFTQTITKEGIISVISGYSQTAFAGNVTLGSPNTGGFLTGCCSRARAIRGDQVVGDSNIGGGLPLAPDPLGLDSSFANNAGSSATLWSLGAPGQPVTLAGAPSVALATNGVQQGGWANAHAVIWSGTRASMTDLNPPGYFDTRVTGLSGEFQVGDGWLSGPANAPGAIQHGLVWKGSAASVIDLNQFLPPNTLNVNINGVDADGNIVGSMVVFTGQEYGLYFTPNPAMSLASFSLAPANPAPGDDLTATITLKAPAAAGVVLNFTSTNPALIPAPPSITIPVGQTSISFPVATTAAYFLAAPASVTLTAHASFTGKSATVTVAPKPAADPLTSFTSGASTIAPGDPINIRVSLAAPAPAGGVLVSFATSNAILAPLPAGITIPAGSTSASLTVTGNAATLFQPVTVLLQAQTGTTILLVNLTIASPTTPGSVALGNPQGALTSVPGNSAGTGFVAFTATPQTAGVVTLSSSNPALVVPPSVPYVAGAFYAPFNYTALPVAALTTGVLSATVNGATVTANISITASPSPGIQSVAVPPTSPTRTFSSGQSLTGTITLTSPAFLGGMTATLATDTPAAVQIPASVAIASNTTSATFTVSALPVAGPTTVTITATLPGMPAASTTVIVIPGPALSLTSLTLAPYSMIGPGVATTASITLNQPAPAGGVNVALSADNPTPAKFPAAVTIPAGQTSATASVQGNSVSSATALTLTASYTGPLAPLGTSTSAALTVAPTDVLKAAKPTWSTSTHLLTATCTSTNPQAIITVLNASGNVPLGTMTNLGNGNYSFQLTIASIASINFKSNLGGSTGQGVTVVP